MSMFKGVLGTILTVARFGLAVSAVKMPFWKVLQNADVKVNTTKNLAQISTQASSVDWYWYLGAVCLLAFVGLTCKKLFTRTCPGFHPPPDRPRDIIQAAKHQEDSDDNFI